MQLVTEGLIIEIVSINGEAEASISRGKLRAGFWLDKEVLSKFKSTIARL